MSSGTAVDPLISGNAGWAEAEGRAAGAGRLWFTDEGPAIALAAGIGRRHGGMRIGVLVDPHRRPVTVLAKQLTGLDVLIGGRLDVGLPAGASAEEVEEAEEVAEVLGVLAGGEPLHHQGRLVRSRGARSLPASPQPGGFPLFRVRGRGPDWVEVVPR